MHFEKKDFPLIRVREHLETGPIVLVTSRHEGRSSPSAASPTILLSKTATSGCPIRRA
jgi:hypothetical protein